jgi:hypothetical protein
MIVGFTNAVPLAPGPTNKFSPIVPDFATPIPPAVLIAPVVVDVESVVLCTLSPPEPTVKLVSVPVDVMFGCACSINSTCY